MAVFKRVLRYGHVAPKTKVWALSCNERRQGNGGLLSLGPNRAHDALLLLLASRVHL